MNSCFFVFLFSIGRCKFIFILVSYLFSMRFSRQIVYLERISTLTSKRSDKAQLCCRFFATLRYADMFHANQTDREKREREKRTRADKLVTQESTSPRSTIWKRASLASTAIWELQRTAWSWWNTKWRSTEELMGRRIAILRHLCSTIAFGWRDRSKTLEEIISSWWKCQTGADIIN